MRECKLYLNKAIKKSVRDLEGKQVLGAEPSSERDSALWKLPRHPWLAE